MTIIKTWLIDPYAVIPILTAEVGDMTPPSRQQMIDLVFKEVELDTEDYANIYPLLTEPDVHEVMMFQPVYLDFMLAEKAKGDSIFIDEEGLFKSGDGWFLLKGYPQPLAGKGLALGVDKEGNSIAPQFITKEWLVENVSVGWENIGWNPRTNQWYMNYFSSIVRFWTYNQMWDSEEEFRKEKDG